MAELLIKAEGTVVYCKLLHNIHISMLGHVNDFYCNFMSVFLMF